MDPDLFQHHVDNHEDRSRYLQLVAIDFTRSNRQKLEREEYAFAWLRDKQEQARVDTPRTTMNPTLKIILIILAILGGILIGNHLAW